METTMYDNLLLLPLFQGLSKNDLTTIIEKVKFHFLTYQDNDTIIRQGDACHELCFLLNGTITVQTTDDEHAFSLSEAMDAPFFIEPQSLFGMHPNYTATYRSKGQSKILKIDKSYIFTELDKYEIIRLNYLNILSNRSQVVYQKLWDSHIGDLNQKFVKFIALRSQNQEGEKLLQITMEDLANLINETRISVSRLLNELQDKNLLQLKRKEIYIPDFKKLTDDLV